MKKNQKRTFLILFSAIIMIGMSLSSYAKNMQELDSGQNTAQDFLSAEVTMSPPSDGMGAAKGCATGAAIGTAIAPGLGTLTGCIIAGIWGWFW